MLTRGKFRAKLATNLISASAGADLSRDVPQHCSGQPAHRHRIGIGIGGVYSRSPAPPAGQMIHTLHAQYTRCLMWMQVQRQEEEHLPQAAPAAAGEGVHALSTLCFVSCSLCCFDFDVLSFGRQITLVVSSRCGSRPVASHRTTPDRCNRRSETAAGAASE